MIDPSAKPGRLFMLGHRGASRYAPENTLAAFDLAITHGCHGFEFDVRRTSDGRAILCHDPAMHDLVIENSTYEQLCLAAHPDPRKGEKTPHIPCLEDVLRRYSDVPYLDIELKIGGHEEEIVELLREHPLRGEYVISSFLEGALERLHELAPDLPLGLISESSSALERVQWPAIRTLFLQYKVVSPEAVEICQRANKQLFTWTVNDPAEMKMLAGLGVDGIISDDTKLLCRTFINSTA